MSEDAELHPEVSALIEETRDAYTPSAASRANVHWALERRLAGAPRGTSFWLYVRRSLFGFAALAVAGGAAAFVWTSRAPQSAALETTAAPVHAPVEAKGAPRGVNQVETAPSAPPTSVAEAQADLPSRAPAVQDALTPSTQASLSRRADDKESSKRTLASLEGEIELLRQVNALRESGNAARALSLLSDYERKNGTGALAQERAAARALCHCTLSRSAQSQALARRFASTYPKSPQLPRVRAACGLEP